MKNVKAGDVVVERNRGQLMTVVKFVDEEHEWVCEWTDAAGEVKQGSFPAFALEAATMSKA